MRDLTAGDLRVTIDEATGGAIVSFTTRDFPLLGARLAPIR
jgi:hypothetical protein